MVATVSGQKSLPDYVWQMLRKRSSWLVCATCCSLPGTTWAESGLLSTEKPYTPQLLAELSSGTHRPPPLPPPIPAIRLVGLFPGAAVVMIDGRRHVLKVGKAGPQGVTLLNTDSSGAMISLNEQSHYLSLERAYGKYTPPARNVVRVLRDSMGRYYTTGNINGVTVRMLVDTGATSIAMNANVARRLGIDYIYQGTPIKVQTASDTVQAYRVRLNSVNVGGIEVRNVDASVLEGAYPREVLLGMSYLKSVRFSENDGILRLEQKY